MRKTRVTHRGNRIGDMRYRVTLHDRDITSPAYGSVDFGEDFTGTDVWAAIKTVSGKIVLDEVGQDIAPTHEVYIRYDGTVTSETFLQLEDGRRLRVIEVEQYDERTDYMRLVCTDRGLNEAAKA